ncbi:MAG TPA: PilZ domain-containing protein [Spirochaetia bacterium]
MGSEQRKTPRVPSYAKAMLVDAQIPGYIRDLSSAGCQVAFMQAQNINVGDLIAVRVIAEHDPGIRPFVVHLRVRWVRQDVPWFTLGGMIEPMDDAEEREVFKRLVAYYTETGA